MKLRTLLSLMPSMVTSASGASVDHPALDADVTGLSTNSHECQPGDLFIGMPGTRVDGGDFWPSALAAGAIAALISPQAFDKTQSAAIETSACLIPFPDMPLACAEASAAFFGSPATKLTLVGVTGTNGKTTTTHLIEFLLNHAQHRTALFGTLYTRWPGYAQTARHTTPFAVELHRRLKDAVDADCHIGVMEVSSHALAQKRVFGCPFEVAAFTNLTQDHLDFHKDVDDYFAAKAQLFQPDYLQGRAIINCDDPYGQKLIQALKAEPNGADVWSYSATQNVAMGGAPGDASADIYATDLAYEPDGVRGILQTPLGSQPFSSPLVGQFNLANLLAAVGVVQSLGVELEQIVAGLPHFSGVPGRMEKIQVSPDQDVSVIVDYAHTPDGLENLLNAARPFVTGRMICVFGCGGDRDRTKRPQMGAIAARLADRAIVTSDNPRTEDPQKILNDIVEGIPADTDAIVLGDRAEAIQTAIATAQPGDGILIAGKGHEDYQILGTEKIHFDD
ncbi:MAG: UDP-N-acetylmuramoyl-L-alanyl-D-glutamate--2,6-diaminopimelate ligase, partial [Cyanobacteria bacterium P01_A01_bin.37]